MSGRYSKYYNRRGSSRGGNSRQPIHQANILFDKMMDDSHQGNKRPSAAKSAGTVGRWGITSFTSLRSTNSNGTREETTAPLPSPKSKRMRVNEYTPSSFSNSSNEDPFSFDQGTDMSDSAAAPANTTKAFVKPRKFFKSRAAEAAQKEPEIRLQASLYMNDPCSDLVARSAEIQYPARKHHFPAEAAPPSKAASKFFASKHKHGESNTSVESAASSHSTPLLSDNSLQAEVKPPIRLRIFKNKGTSHLVSETQVLMNDSPEDMHQQSDSPPVEEETQPSPEECYDLNQVSQEVTTPSLDVDLNLEPSQEEALEQTEPSPDPVIPEQEVPGHDQIMDLEKEEEDKAKLLKAEELLSSTYVDFSATEKLLIDPKQILPTSSKSALANDWFSEDEDDSATDLTQSQGVDDEAALSQPEQSQVGELSSFEPNLEQPMIVEENSQPLEDQPLSQPEVEDTKTQSLQKKGSIFKSRRLLTGGPKKRLALYKHKWTDEDKEKNAGAAGAAKAAAAAAAPNTAYDEDFTEEPAVLTRVTRPAESNVATDEDADPVTGVLCSRAARKYYTVVRDVKNAHQMQETGEFYVFNDDVDYILDALADNNPIATRCLSAISLATKCMAPAFRMHVRAHGIVTKFFSALHDATLDPSLALCTATVMFVMSQDQLNMDLDRASLELMLNLLDTDASHHNALDTLVEQGISGSQLDKNKRKVRELCEEIKSKGHAKHLNLDNITVGNLAMESLLSLTSRRAGEWFKEELRLLGGLEHIVKTVSECCRTLSAREEKTWDEADLAKLKKVDRCLKVLFNLTSKNLENQQYLLTFEQSQVVDLMVQLLRMCLQEVPLHPVILPADKEGVAFTLQEALLSTMKLLVDLTHNSDGKALGSKMIGERSGVVDSCLYCVMRLPAFFQEEKQFDIMVVGLCLLINLVECPPSNRALIINARAPPDEDDIFYGQKSAIDALIDLFNKNEAIAKIEEGRTDAILASKKEEIIPEAEQATKTPDEIFNEIVEKLLQKAGKNMECNLIQAYISMLIGYVVMDNKEYEAIVREKLPENNFQAMLKVLKKFVNFMVLTISTVSKSRSILDTERLIEYLKSIDGDIKEEKPDLDSLRMNC